MPSSRSSSSNTSIYRCCLLRQCSFFASGDPMPLPTNHVTIFPMKMRRICTILTWFGLLLLFTFVLFYVIQVLKQLCQNFHNSHLFKRSSLTLSKQSGPRLEKFCLEYKFQDVLFTGTKQCGERLV